MCHEPLTPSDQQRWTPENIWIAIAARARGYGSVVRDGTAFQKTTTLLAKFWFVWHDSVHTRINHLHDS